LRMGDGDTTDLWYPYWQLADGGLKHACQLASGDRVCFYPSRFDFTFLDSSARRFEIGAGAAERRARPTRPWLLSDLARLERLWDDHLAKLQTTQLYQVISIIERAREEWGVSGVDNTFDRFVRDTLAGAKWPDGHNLDDIPELTEAGVSGHLADLAELHLHILKEKVGEDWHGNL